jgi:hypothetical protein
MPETKPKSRNRRSSEAILEWHNERVSAAEETLATRISAREEFVVRVKARAAAMLKSVS